MREVNTILREAMQKGSGVPVVKLYYAKPANLIQDEDGNLFTTENGNFFSADYYTEIEYLVSEDGDYIIDEKDNYILGAGGQEVFSQDVITYKMSRLQLHVTVNVVEGREPAQYANLLRIERGLKIGGIERLISSPTYYLDSFIINKEQGTVRYSGQILPDIKVDIANANQNAQTVLEGIFNTHQIPINFTSGADTWYLWQFENAAEYKLTNLGSLLSALRKKYMALILPRSSGMEFGHPGTFAGDEFTDYLPQGNTKQTQVISQEYNLRWEDETETEHTYDNGQLPWHDFGFIHSDITNTEVILLRYILVGGDNFEQRPDFRIEHGDKITMLAGQGYTNIACCEWIETYEPGKGRLPWMQEIKPINHKANITFRPFLNAAGDTWDNPTG